MDHSLIRDFWNCGDSLLIDYSLSRARLNRKELEVLDLLLDQALTQEQAAEKLQISVRNLQNLWYTGTAKLLNLPWVIAYAKELRYNK